MPYHLVLHRRNLFTWSSTSWQDAKSNMDKARKSWKLIGRTIYASLSLSKGASSHFISPTLLYKHDSIADQFSANFSSPVRLFPDGPSVFPDESDAVHMNSWRDIEACASFSDSFRQKKYNISLPGSELPRKAEMTICEKCSASTFKSMLDHRTDGLHI
jgi:hypothetical protein